MPRVPLLAVGPHVAHGDASVQHKWSGRRHSLAAWRSVKLAVGRLRAARLRRRANDVAAKDRARVARPVAQEVLASRAPRVHHQGGARGHYSRGFGRLLGRAREHRERPLLLGH